MRILCTGDIHLGRYPSRVPAGEREFSVAHVWTRIVDRAIDLSVDVVALTGDVVDRENRYYEAMGPLERGLLRLSEAGIVTFAVSGNHDFDVLPRLVDTVDVDDFYLLGRGGAWETHLLERDGEPVLRVVGWSFPNEHFRASPLADLEALEASAVPTVGLLHADLDQPGSPYAPAKTSELAEHELDAWLLGHIHKPTLRRTSSRGVILYPGSPQALDPGERGEHGPWLIEVASGLEPTASQVPLASVRYRELDVDLEDVDSVEAFHRIVPERVHADLRDIATGAGSLRQVVYRLRYHGRTALHRKLEEASATLLTDFERSFERVSASVDKVVVDTLPKVNLAEIAEGHDPPAVLASLLLELKSGDISPERRPLLRRLRRQVTDIHQSNAHAPLREDRRTVGPPDDDQLRRMAFAEGMSLLDEMLAQKRKEVQ